MISFSTPRVSGHLALLVLLCIRGSSASYAAGSGDHPTDCPIHFNNLSSPLHKSDLSELELATRGDGAAALFIPRSEGFYAIRVDPSAIDNQEICGAYSIERPQTFEYPVSMGLRGVDWSTVAEASDSSTSEVPAGTYRIVLRYVSPSTLGPSKSEPASDDLASVCLIVSPPFELSEPFYLLHLE